MIGGGECVLWISGDIACYKCLSFEDGLMSDLKKIKNDITNKYNSFIIEPTFRTDQAPCIWYLENSKWVKHGK